jgi:hypothetical protein
MLSKIQSCGDCTRGIKVRSGYLELLQDVVRLLLSACFLHLLFVLDIQICKEGGGMEEDVHLHKTMSQGYGCSSNCYEQPILKCMQSSHS